MTNIDALKLCSQTCLRGDSTTREVNYMLKTQKVLEDANWKLNFFNEQFVTLLRRFQNYLVPLTQNDTLCKTTHETEFNLHENHPRGYSYEWLRTKVRLHTEKKGNWKMTYLRFAGQSTLSV